jgi:hypothetical protein
MFTSFAPHFDQGTLQEVIRLPGGGHLCSGARALSTAKVRVAAEVESNRPRQSGSSCRVRSGYGHWCEPRSASLTVANEGLLIVDTKNPGQANYAFGVPLFTRSTSQLTTYFTGLSETSLV